jgi:hypothetical protein
MILTSSGSGVAPVLRLPRPMGNEEPNPACVVSSTQSKSINITGKQNFNKTIFLVF